MQEEIEFDKQPFPIERQRGGDPLEQALDRSSIDAVAEQLGDLLSGSFRALVVELEEEFFETLELGVERPPGVASGRAHLLDAHLPESFCRENVKRCSEQSGADLGEAAAAVTRRAGAATASSGS